MSRIDEDDSGDNNNSISSKKKNLVLAKLMTETIASWNWRARKLYNFIIKINSIKNFQYLFIKYWISYIYIFLYIDIPSIIKFLIHQLLLKNITRWKMNSWRILCIYLPNPSAWTVYDTRSFFLAEFNRFEFRVSFS